MSTTMPTYNVSDHTPVTNNPSSVGLAVGLSVFFLLLVILVLVIFYLKRNHRSVWRLDRTRPGKREESEQIEQRATPHQYSTMGRAPCDAGQSPVYENYSGMPPQDRRPSGEEYMSPRGTEEDLYYQCDATDDAIYLNDPNCSLAMLPEPEDGEDPYIIPDAL